MTLIEKRGDLFTSDAPALAHGVNCDGLMGAGIAVAFREKFPAMFKFYKQWCESGDLIPGSMMVWEDQESDLTIYNIASQDRPGRNARIDWLESGLQDVINDAFAYNIDRIAMPRIGCGIGGLKWPDVVTVLKRYADKIDIEVWTL